VVCGRNQLLADQLRADGIEHVHGWTDDMPGLMHACDVLVQNAGGLTSLEALACGLPVASYRCIPGHGQTNAAALDEAGLAVWIRQTPDLAPLLRELLDGVRGQAQREAGLALHASRPGPADVIAAVAPAAPRRPAVRPSRAGRRRVTVLAAAALATVALGIGVPIGQAYGEAPRLGTVAQYLEGATR
jgi:UDP-N-acetylglucosamine:LPS N-acetylglucosamine transferase